LQAVSRLLTGGPLDPDALGQGGRDLVLREAGFATLDDLAAAIETVAQRADAVITARLAQEGLRDAAN
jgi:glutamate-ammonia-ligase adenylyltransferase